MNKGTAFSICFGLALALASLSARPAMAQTARKPGLYATFQTDMGNIVVELYEKEAPITVKNFTDLADGKKEYKDPRTGQMKKARYYDGTVFHRVIPEFMIQGGDPTGTGMGDPGYKFKNESTAGINFDKPGRLAMANAGRDTNGSQFFITEGPVPLQAADYTIFGQVVDGLDVVKKIARVPKDPSNPEHSKPVTPPVLKKVLIERVRIGRKGETVMATSETPAAGLRAIIQTSQGKVVCELFEKDAPVTVKNFVDLAEGNKEYQDPNTGEKKKGRYYDGTIFHRVIPDFMIQGGDPTGTGRGGPGYQFQDEFHPGLRFDQPGRLAMANAGPRTNGSQFFITEVNTEYLNNKHTIFGQVIEGMDVVKKIARVPKGPGDKPTTPVVIQKLTIEHVPAAK